ncbi:unnamed protein product [Lampetra planeri]
MLSRSLSCSLSRSLTLTHLGCCRPGRHHARSPGGSVLLKAPIWRVLGSRNCSSWRCARRIIISMRITSERGKAALRRNSARMCGVKPGLSWAARNSCLYRPSTCFCRRLSTLMDSRVNSETLIRPSRTSS